MKTFGMTGACRLLFLLFNLSKGKNDAAKNQYEYRIENEPAATGRLLAEVSNTLGIHATLLDSAGVEDLGPCRA